MWYSFVGFLMVAGIPYSLLAMLVPLAAIDWLQDGFSESFGSPLRRSPEDSPRGGAGAVVCTPPVSTLVDDWNDTMDRTRARRSREEDECETAEDQDTPSRAIHAPKRQRDMARAPAPFVPGPTRLATLPVSRPIAARKRTETVIGAPRGRGRVSSDVLQLIFPKQVGRTKRKLFQNQDDLRGDAAADTSRTLLPEPAQLPVPGRHCADGKSGRRGGRR